MEYRYREIKCPWCDHVFMWNRDGREGLILHKYRLKETGEFVENTKCPKCYEDMVVLENILEGVEIKDNRIESINDEDDSSSYVNSQNKKLRANCPCCWAFCDDIVYQNSRPIVRVYCTKCGLVYNENDARKNGFSNVIDYWNHIGVYMPHD